ncbi:hypothetical protein [Streptomyces sp. TRM68367]|uniref:hypothetical protein n=1 Tax=Streptomyces sp. TRM68367 TaxID=2758415 RepID=UPI00165B9ABE|nr:hypothetical protein [Streptomyces sp. TRM68367]MBC9726522.1 hypothetical protein [Streptomyces sp. TRM68367]
MNHQIIVDSTPHLSAEDFAALRENLHEQRLFRQEQLRQLAGPVALRIEDRLQQQDAAREGRGGFLADSDEARVRE